jgi:hypothetical protein
VSDEDSVRAALHRYWRPMARRTLASRWPRLALEAKRGPHLAAEPALGLPRAAVLAEAIRGEGGQDDRSSDDDGAPGLGSHYPR